MCCGRHGMRLSHAAMYHMPSLCKMKEVNKEVMQALKSPAAQLGRSLGARSPGWFIAAAQL